MRRVILTYLIFTLIGGCKKDNPSPSEGFKYRRSITIVNNSPTNLTNFQVKLVINTRDLISSGKMRSDCGDMRFTLDDGKTYIPYWIESGVNTTNTIVWVKIPEIPATSTVKIYMLYGNMDSLDMSNGDSVFLFFDNFERNTIGTKWQINTGYNLLDTAVPCCAYISGGEAILQVGSIYSLYSFISKSFKASRPFIAEMKFLTNDFIGNTAFIQFYDPADTLNFNLRSYSTYISDERIVIRVGEDTTYNEIYGDSISREHTKEYIMRFIVGGYSIYGSLLDTSYNIVGSVSHANNWYDNYNVGFYHEGTILTSMRVDWFRVRKYIYPEPTYIIGQEEKI